MQNYLTSPDCSSYSTVKLFCGMLDELKEKMNKEEYDYFLENIIQLKKKEVNSLKFNNEHFRKLIEFYLKDKSSPTEEQLQARRKKMIMKDYAINSRKILIRELEYRLQLEKYFIRAIKPKMYGIGRIVAVS